MFLLRCTVVRLTSSARSHSIYEKKNISHLRVPRILQTGYDLRIERRGKKTLLCSTLRKQIYSVTPHSDVDVHNDFTRRSCQVSTSNMKSQTVQNTNKFPCLHRYGEAAKLARDPDVRNEELLKTFHRSLTAATKVTETVVLGFFVRCLNEVVERLIGVTLRSGCARSCRLFHDTAHEPPISVLTQPGPMFRPRYFCCCRNEKKYARFERRSVTQKGNSSSSHIFPRYVFRSFPKIGYLFLFRLTEGSNVAANRPYGAECRIQYILLHLSDSTVGVHCSG